MRRGRLFIFLAVILILAIVAILVFGQGLLKPPTQQTGGGGPTPTPLVTTKVVVVSQHVSRGQKLSADVIKEIDYPQHLVVEGMVSSVTEADGRIAKIDLEPGYVLTRLMLVDSSGQVSQTGSDAALLIPRGMVAISIPISRLSSVSYAIRKGDHINIISTMAFVDLDTEWQSLLPNQTIGVTAAGEAISTLGGGSSSTQGSEGENLVAATGETTLQVTSSSLVAVPGGGGSLQGRVFEEPALGEALYLAPAESQRPRLMSQTLLQDIIVLQVGTFELEETGPQPAPTPIGGEIAPVDQQNLQPTPQPQVVDDRPPDIITLIVTPQDAVTLNYLLYSGAELTLTLRGANDDTRVQTEAVTLQFLLTQYNIPVPVKLPYGINPGISDVNAPVLPNDTPLPTPLP
jgi:pilus assembly protein CpaB